MRSSRRLRAAAATFALAAVALPAAGGSPALAGDPAYQLEDIGDFRSPVHVDDAPGASDLLFVVEQRGTIAVLDNGTEQDEPFLDIRDIVQFSGEDGLLSVAFHPDYATNRRFYAYYTNNRGDSRVAQFKRKPSDPLRARPNSRAAILKIRHRNAFHHNGGQLQFHPTDGDLFISTGDATDGDNAQDPGNLLGKILRITPTLDGGYDVPAGNPFAGGGGRGEIMAMGLRNPWRFSFDSLTGDIVIADVGQSAWEEVDYETVTDLNGANFGWNCFEGFADYQGGCDPGPANNEPPIAAFSHGEPDNFCSITGGYVVRDPGLPDLLGEYLFGDVCADALRTIQVPSGAAGTDLNVGSETVVAFGEGEGRQLYVVDYGGDVFAVEPPA